MNAMFALIIGGARSGKTSLAVEIGSRHDGAVTYVATSPRIDGDADLDRRINLHRSERPDHWRTVEEPIDLGAAIAAEPSAMVIVDCLTLWVNNLLWRGDGAGEVEQLARSCAGTAARRTAHTVVITNEVGLGVHPETEVGRSYRDVLGRVNQIWAQAADRTILMAAGRAVELTDPLSVLDRGR